MRQIGNIFQAIFGISVRKNRNALRNLLECLQPTTFRQQSNTTMSSVSVVFVFRQHIILAGVAVTWVSSNKSDRWSLVEAI